MFCCLVDRNWEEMNDGLLLTHSVSVFLWIWGLEWICGLHLGFDLARLIPVVFQRSIRQILNEINSTLLQDVMCTLE